MAIALLAFELFNFDTTQFALQSLLGDVSFARLQWATILAIAFCAIDFAGLARIFTPTNDHTETSEQWYLTGAWLIGATMNAIMTWWAVSLALLNHNFGNEVLSRGQLLHIVPIFVAVLVWLTRILFIGSLAATGGELLQGRRAEKSVAIQPVHRTIARLRPNDGLSHRKMPEPELAILADTPQSEPILTPPPAPRTPPRYVRRQPHL